MKIFELNSFNAIQILENAGFDVNKDLDECQKVFDENSIFSNRFVVPLILDDTPLTFAARWGDCDLARTLLAEGAKIDASSDNNLTPYLIAIQHGRASMVKLLLENGASPQQCVKGTSHGSKYFFEQGQSSSKLMLFSWTQYEKFRGREVNYDEVRNIVNSKKLGLI